MQKKTKILILTRPLSPPWDEGSKNFAFSLANQINDPDLEIHVLTHGQLEGLPKNVVQHEIYSDSKWNIIQKIRCYAFLIKIFLFQTKSGIDILHSFFTPTKLNTWALRKVIFNDSLKIIQTLATLREDLYSLAEIKKILKGNLIVTYSNYAKSKLMALGMENVKRVYPGIDLEKFKPKPVNFELAEKFDIRANDFVINFTGEYSRMGAIDDVVETFIDLSNERANFKLFLAVRIKNSADARKKSEVVGRLREAGVLDQVIFADDQKYEMEDVYNLATISIFPVRDMAGKFDIPLAVIEAMACQRPMIATDIERIRYFLNEKNSILIHPGKTFELREKILFLHDNPQKAEELGEKGMSYVRENFDIRKVVKEYEEIYRNL